MTKQNAYKGNEKEIELQKTHSSKSNRSQVERSPPALRGQIVPFVLQALIPSSDHTTVLVQTQQPSSLSE